MPNHASSHAQGPACPRATAKTLTVAGGGTRGPTRWVAVFVALFAAGCATLVPLPPAPAPAASFRHLPADARGASDHQAAVQALEAWWQQVRPEITSKLVAAIDEAHPQIAAARARWAQAEAQARAAGADRLPQLSASGALSRAQGSAALSPTASVQQQARIGAEVRFDPDLFGQKAAAAEAARERERAAWWDWQQSRRTVLADALRAWLDWTAAEQRLALNTEQQHVVERTRSLVAARVAAGLSSARELAQSQALVAQLAAQRQALEATRAAAYERLVAHVGQARAPALSPQAWLGQARRGTATGDLRPIEEQAIASLPGQTQPLAETGQGVIAPTLLPADVLRARADVAAAERRLAAALASARSAVAAQYPAFPLTGTLAQAAANPAAWWSASATTWSIAWNLSATLFDAGRLQAQAEAANAAMLEAAAQWQQTVRTALREAETALAQWQHEQARRVRLREAALASERAWRLIEAQYRAGLVDFALVLDAQRQWLVAQETLSDAEAALRAAALQLYAALGGPWNETKGRGDE